MIQTVFSRPRFFDGRLLTAQDLQAEQAYHREKARFRNLHLHGTGVISGLEIQIGRDRTSITITPGYAIDGYGRDICVPDNLSIAVPPESKGLSVWIRYIETASAPVPGSSSSITLENQAVNACIEEGFEIDFNSIPQRTGGHQPEPLPPSDQPCEWLLLGVIRRRGNTWRLNPNRRVSHTRPVKRRPTRTSRTRQ